MRCFYFDTMLFYLALFISLADCFLQREEQISKTLEKEQLARGQADTRNADSWRPPGFYDVVVSALSRRTWR